MKNVKILLQKCMTEIIKKLDGIKLLCLYLVQHMLHQNKGTILY